MTGGYDPADVPAKLCLLCEQPIGDLEWREVKTLARFGQMMFEHVVCPPKPFLTHADLPKPTIGGQPVKLKAGRFKRSRLGARYNGQHRD